MKKFFGLGRGLESLIPAKTTKVIPKIQDNVFYIEINKIKPNPGQPRREFDKDGLKELATSIKKYGVLQPLLVSKIETETDKGLNVEYELITGERRWRAEIIGGGVSSHFELNFQDVLGRNRNHIPQAQISDRQSRITNTAGIFKCMKTELVQNKTILLIDDISTTGSTLDDCARALKGAGAREIIGFVFAKGNLLKRQLI